MDPGDNAIAVVDSDSRYQNRRRRHETPGTIGNQVRTERTTKRYENDVQRDDERPTAIVKAMVSVVAAMALFVEMTVLVFQSGGTILA
jgi:hypothetical protein